MNNRRGTAHSARDTDAFEESAPITNAFDITLLMPIEWANDLDSLDSRFDVSEVGR